MRAAWVLALVLAGCVAPAVETTPAAPRVATSTVAIDGCTCWEPAVAVDPSDRVFVVLGGDPQLVASEDGGLTFDARVHPPVPPGAPPQLRRVDGYVAVGPDETLHYIAFVSSTPAFTSPPIGLQHARSLDGGRTWESNTFLSLLTTPQQGVLSPWKSWIGFGHDDDVYIVYNQRGGLVVFGRSDDGGLTWGPFRAINVPGDRAVSNFPAAPVVDEAGRLYVAYFGDQSPNAPNPFLFRGHTLRVALSDDRGDTFRTVVAAEADFPDWVGTMFPSFVVAGEAAHVAYVRPDGRVEARSSADRGETWGEPVAWSETAAYSAPWMLASHGEVALVVEERVDEAWALVASRAPADAAHEGPALRTVLRDGTDGIGDFVHFARLSDGSFVAPWVDWDDAEVHVAVVPPHDGAPPSAAKR